MAIERTYTDQDVARILQRAAELDTSVESVPLVKGLGLSELQEIAQAAGFDPALVARAVAELDRTPSHSSHPFFGRAPASRQTRVVPGALSREAIGELIAVVDEHVPAQGSVGEALGLVRWSVSDRSLSRQVAIKPSVQETLIRVEERYSDAVRGILHGLPTAYGLVFGMAIGLNAIGGLLPGAMVSVALGAAGWGLGRSIWNALLRRSRRRVDVLADALVAEAIQLRESAGSPEGPEETGSPSGKRQ